MHPELFEIPFVDGLTVKSYGLMMVVGFLCAVGIIRRLSRDITPDPQYITNAALYSLIGGVVGARLFYVIHYWDSFRDNLMGVFAIWKGGLELLGGVIMAVSIIFLYMVYHKLSIRRYLDVLGIGLMAALIFGRIGCFMNGCCYGKPTELPWGVRFPYNSFSYRSQVNPDPDRGREEPYFKLPADYFAYVGPEGRRVLKPFEELTEDQRYEVAKGQYRAMPVHPTQLYSSAAPALGTLLLFLFWRRARDAGFGVKDKKFLVKPGCTFAMMLLIYAAIRFPMEFLRDDNPFEIDHLTVSQLISIGLTVFALMLLVLFEKLKPDKPRIAGTADKGQKAAGQKTESGD